MAKAKREFNWSGWNVKIHCTKSNCPAALVPGYGATITGPDGTIYYSGICGYDAVEDAIFEAGRFVQKKQAIIDATPKSLDLLIQEELQGDER